MLTPVAVRRVRSATVPPGPVNFTAFWRRLTRICCKARSSAEIVKPGSPSTTSDSALARATKLVSELARSKDLTLVVEGLPGFTIPADERALQQILVNLLQNAAKFTGAGGTVALRARRATTGVNIYVEDTGIGIPKEALGKLGRPFEQVETEFNKTYKGSGLGLAIARSLSELHGGSLRIRSQEGVGTIVMVHLPMKLPHKIAMLPAPETVH